MLRAIVIHVANAAARANWRGEIIELPYPGKHASIIAAKANVSRCSQTTKRDSGLPSLHSNFQKSSRDQRENLRRQQNQDCSGNKLTATLHEFCARQLGDEKKHRGAHDLTEEEKHCASCREDPRHLGDFFGEHYVKKM